MPMEYYTVLWDWVCGLDRGVDIICITPSIFEAKKAFSKKLKEEKKFAEENGYTIYEDTDMIFDAGIDGFYNEDHTSLKIKSDKSYCVNKERIERALVCLSDNGVPKDECPEVLQALCYILLDEETESYLGKDVDNI